MAFTDLEFPMEIRISFNKLVRSYRDFLKGSDELMKERAQRVMDLVEAYPELITGIRNFDELKRYQKHIDLILADLFAGILQQNEIKVATLPFNEHIIQSSARYDRIIELAGDGFSPRIKNFSDDAMYIMGCSIILNMHYGYNIDFKRPFFYQIPDENGLVRHYRLLYNGDYVEVEKKPETPDISEEDVAELLDNFDNIALWKAKFPPNSWIFKGFVIANLYDATTDVSLSEFKTSLLKYEKNGDNFTASFQEIFRSIFNLTDIKVGFANYNAETASLEKVPFKNVDSFVLNAQYRMTCKSALCGGSYHKLLQEKEVFAVSDVAKYYEFDTSEHLYKNLYDQNIKSALFAPIVHEDAFLGLMEIVSPHKHELNSINANKLLDVMPYLVDAVLRSKARIDNELEVIIQNECTSIHQSVYWKFRDEAKRVMQAQIQEDASISFRDIVFKDVYPLYGQVDIVGSSAARNKAVQQDLLLQLSLAADIIKQATDIEPLPIYQELLFRLSSYTGDIKDHLEVDSEQKVLTFFMEEIRPLFDHFSAMNPDLKVIIEAYRDRLDKGMGLIYEHRKAYDESVMRVNKKLASVLDKNQKEAQAMYPHFFERFKTDGVEHNMYVGESITRENSFNEIYLYNLRLWQLQAICEMENAHYALSRKLSYPLDVASMVLVFNTSLSVRFRMDEKRFDVDGTYNARYEVVKKRVDKAFIKGTTERVTQPGKITIVYSHKDDEREYLGYISFLQAKNYVGKEVEVLELQDLQAVTGLKAIRVNVLYKSQQGAPKKYYTYDDLIKEIQS